MRHILFLVLFLFATIAHAGQTKAFKKAGGKAVVHYTTYQAPSMRKKDLGPIATVFRKCVRYSAKQFVKQERLAKNRNIAGAFYCKQAGETRAYAVVKKLT